MYAVKIKIINDVINLHKHVTGYLLSQDIICPGCAKYESYLALMGAPPLCETSKEVGLGIKEFQ